MAVRLGGSETNAIIFQDNISGTEVEMTYRMPTTAEENEYTNLTMFRRGKKLVSARATARKRFGLKILCGIRDGDFEGFRDGKYIPISSNPESPHYMKDWKTFMQTYGSRFLELLAAHVFDAPVVMNTQTDDEEDTVPDMDDDEDAEKN